MVLVAMHLWALRIVFGDRGPKLPVDKTDNKKRNTSEVGMAFQSPLTSIRQDQCAKDNGTALEVHDVPVAICPLVKLSRGSWGSWEDEGGHCQSCM